MPLVANQLTFVFLVNHIHIVRVPDYVADILQLANETIIFQPEPRVYNAKVNKSFVDENQYGESYNVFVTFFCGEHTKKAWSQTPKDAVEMIAIL